MLSSLVRWGDRVSGRAGEGREARDLSQVSANVWIRGFPRAPGTHHHETADGTRGDGRGVHRAAGLANRGRAHGVDETTQHRAASGCEPRRVCAH
jgi:hypothetical protein